MWRTLLLNRFSLTFGGLGLVALVWNINVMASNDGLLTGQVVNQNGDPVAGAQVVISELSAINRNLIAAVTTDDEGRFEFVNHERHAMILQADKEGVGQSRRHNVKLYFRNQNRALKEPVVLDENIIGGPKISKQSGSN